MKIKNAIILLCFLIFSCENPVSTASDVHCVADLGGYIDDCGVCSGGTSDHDANSDKDCSGYIVDDEIFCDCEGNILDDCGVCNGDNLGVQNDPYPCDFNGDQKNLNNISHHH